jgi:Kef-type K+ transport system membrane component KefB
LVLWGRPQEKFVLEFFREQFKEHGRTKSLHCGIMTFCIAVPFGFGVLIVFTYLNHETEFLDALW